MSYIVTYENDGKVDANGVPYLRAKADDGIHGKHNTLFPKGAKAAKLGIPSRYDMKNAGVQIEVNNLTWIASSARAGYYTVSEADIIGVVTPGTQPTTQQVQQPKQQQAKTGYMAVHASLLDDGQLVELDPNVYTNCTPIYWGKTTKRVGYADNSGVIVYYDDTNKSFEKKVTVSGIPLYEDGALDIEFPNKKTNTNLAVTLGVIQGYSTSPGNSPFRLVIFTPNAWGLNMFKPVGDDPVADSKKEVDVPKEQETPQVEAPQPEVKPIDKAKVSEEPAEVYRKFDIGRFKKKQNLSSR